MNACQTCRFFHIVDNEHGVGNCMKMNVHVAFSFSCEQYAISLRTLFDRNEVDHAPTA